MCSGLCKLALSYRSLTDSLGLNYQVCNCYNKMLSSTWSYMSTSVLPKECRIPVWAQVLLLWILYP